MMVPDRTGPRPGTDMARRNPPWQRDELILALVCADVLGLPRMDALFNVADPQAVYDKAMPAPGEFI